MRTEWSAIDLLATDFPEPSWAVPGLIPEGVALLVGAPKTGKSWLALGLAVSVARGGKALGNIQCAPGDVHYLALEDPPRRIRNRLRMLLGDEPAPARLTISTEWQGTEQVERWLAGHPDARLVIVDVLAMVRGFDLSDNAYQADYNSLQAFKELAERFGVAIILVHHTRKMGAEDWLERVSGTFGLAGAADAVLWLERSRGADDGRLHFTGRDVEDDERALAFDPPHGRWTVLEGPARVYDLSGQRREIRRVLDEEDGLGPKAIAERTGIGHDSVRQLLGRMVKEGDLTKDGRGRYTVHIVHSNPLTSTFAETAVHIPGSPVHIAATDVTDVNGCERDQFTSDHAPDQDFSSYVNDVNTFDTPKRKRKKKASDQAHWMAPPNPPHPMKGNPPHE